MADLNFTPVDAGKLKDELITRVESATGEPLYPGDERRIFSEGVAYALSVFISATNESCRARLLKYASGYALDALGERVGCTRLEPTPARTKLKFALAAARNVATVVPAGTRCTADNTILWATDISCTIPTGELSAEAPATAASGGSRTNGIPAGTVQTFVDDVPFVVGVVNMTESAGGDNGEPYPVALDPENGDDGTGDNHYRERIALAPSGFSVAGPGAAYEYHAKSANANISDVKVMSNQAAGRVEIYLVERGGVDPSPEVIEEVTAAVTAEDVKPLGDLVSVSAPAKIEYGIRLTYYCTQSQESETVEAIEGTEGSIRKYITWQGEKIGRDINPDKLRSLCLGFCNRLDVDTPSFVNISNSQIARWNGELEVSHVIVSE